MNGFFAAVLLPVVMLWSCAAKYPLYVFLLPVLLFAFTPAEAQIVWVPDQQPTIQAAINAATNGNTIFVRPGVYFENIKFLGKSVSVVSEKGATVTTIDGGQRDSVVTYSGGEHGVLSGFTIRNGRSGFDTPGFGNGGGIRMDNSAQPTIVQNIITGNRACSGGGISASFSSPNISENLITDNVPVRL